MNVHPQRSMRSVSVRTFSAISATILAFSSTTAAAQNGDPLTRPYPDAACSSCAEWNQPQAPVRLHGNTYYVGTHGLTALLITSPEGHVLIDGALPNSAPLIMENVRALGVRVEDIKLILNSHVHFDHAGGLAALQRASGARVAASVPSAPVLEAGTSAAGDPQHGSLLDFPAVRNVRRFADGETLRVGPIAVTAHLTPGHTQGGTTWTWRSCDDAGQGSEWLHAIPTSQHAAAISIKITPSGLPAIAANSDESSNIAATIARVKPIQPRRLTGCANIKPDNTAHTGMV